MGVKRFVIDNRTYELTVSSQKNSFEISIDGKTTTATLIEKNQNTLFLEIEGTVHKATYSQDADGIHLKLADTSLRISKPASRKKFQ